MFVSGKPFHLSLTFGGKARAYPIDEPYRCSTLGQALGHALKQKIRMERFARDKHSSLLQKFVNYGQISFITLPLVACTTNIVTPLCLSNYDCKVRFNLKRTL